MKPVELSVVARSDGVRHTIVLTGELDMATASRLEAAVAAAIARGDRELVLDLRGVTFMDSTGLRALLRARQQCEDGGGQFYVMRAQSGAQHQLFHVSGLIGKLTFREPPPRSRANGDELSTASD